MSGFVSGFKESLTKSMGTAPKVELKLEREIES